MSNESEQITIEGHPFQVPTPYAEGHTLSASEANALNQALHSNLRNIWAPRVKRAKENGETNLETLQPEFDRYAADYRFGVRRKRGADGPGPDPAAGMALTMAKDRVRKAVKAKGLDWSTAKVSEAAQQLLDRQGAEGPLITAARQRVEAERAAGAAIMADVDSLLDEQAA